MAAAAFVSSPHPDQKVREPAREAYTLAPPIILKLARPQIGYLISRYARITTNKVFDDRQQSAGPEPAL